MLHIVSMKADFAYDSMNDARVGLAPALNSMTLNLKGGGERAVDRARRRSMMPPAAMSRAIFRNVKFGGATEGNCRGCESERQRHAGGEDDRKGPVGHESGSREM